MFKELILESLATGPKTTEEILAFVDTAKPFAWIGAPCQHPDSEMNCQFEWQYQTLSDQRELAAEDKIVLREGAWHLLHRAPGATHVEQALPDLSTTYLGLTLRSPIVASACPLTAEIDVLQRLEERGVGAAVMPSLFEEQIEHPEPRVAELHSAPRWTRSLYEFLQLASYNGGPNAYLKHLETARKAVSIPIFGSMNVTRQDGWLNYARRIEEAGADALEVNAYYVATDPAMTSLDVENRYVDLVAAVRSRISIPLAVKIGPYFTSLPNFARRLVDAGANGLVMFNRYLQADIDVTRLEVKPAMVLSSPGELRAVLRALAILRNQLTCSLGATGGVDNADDVVKAILMGADAVLVASTVYRHGIEQVGKLHADLTRWLKDSGYPAIRNVRGLLSLASCPNSAAFERANYAKAMSAFAEGG